ncbi:fungal hydrophobin [Pisolithus marmoratus]|nr:fungal hydrophobin [Pisolithus marmoratus]
MYIRASALLFPVYALASLAAAAPGGIEARGGGSSCTSGTQMCCQQTYSADSTGVAAIKALLGFTVNPVIGPLLATGCTGFVGSCNAQTVCCQSSQDNNLVYVGCNNIAV